MTENQIYDLLNDHNIKTPKHKSFNIYEEFDVDFFPVALKIESEKVIHKSDFGAVKLNINNLKELNNAKRVIIKNLSTHNISLDEDDKFIVTEMIEGEEFYIGAIEDSIFSKVILFGKGGIYLEIDRDICYIDINSDEKEILSAFNRTKISKLFPQFRGKKYNFLDVINLVKNFQNLLKHNEIISEIDINPLIYREEDGFIAVDARVKFAYNKKREPSNKERVNFFDNRNILIYGVSSNRDKIGYALAKNSLNSKANIYFIGKNKKEIFGKKVYQSIDEIKVKIDMVVIALPAPLVVDLIKKLIPKGIKNYIIISAGFKESGNIKDELLLTKLAKEYKLNIIGPNCLGYYNAKIDLNLTFAKSKILKGTNGIISQSGAVLSALIDIATKNNIGFSHIISLGNMCDLGFSHLIKMLNEDETCETISIYAEGLIDGKEFLEQIRKSKKPIYFFKVGKSEASRRAAFSHTGNLSGSYQMFVNLLKNMGVIIKEDINSLIFSPKYKNLTNVLVVTNAGGPAAILSDFIEETRAKLYELKYEDIEALNRVLPPIWSKNNPIDIIGDAGEERYKKTLEVVEKFEKVDLILIVITPQFMTNPLNIVKLLKNSYKKEIIPILLGGEEIKEAKEFLDKEKIFYLETLRGVKDIF